MDTLEMCMPESMICGNLRQRCHMKVNILEVKVIITILYVLQ